MRCRCNINPDREIFEWAFRRFAIAAEHTLFIDDKADDIDAARALGMKGFVYDGGQVCISAAKDLIEGMMAT